MPRTSKKLISGFDYQNGCAVEFTKSEWVITIEKAIMHGGFRRVENGETFLHGKDGLLICEVYENIGLKKCD